MTHELLCAPSGITYPVWQAGAGTPLILLHGFTGSHETWCHVADCFTGSNLVTTLDLPGHGESQLPPAQDWSFASVIADLSWLIDSLLGGSADVLGYSMGGRLALALALTHPGRVRALVLESASPGLADDQERLARQLADEQLADQILQDGVDAFVARWERLPLWDSQAALPRSTRERQRQTRSGHSAGGLAANLRAMGTGAQPSYWNQLASLATPALLIAGELDGKFASIATRMCDVLPDARLEIVPNAGHAVHLEQPERYVELVAQFLNQPTVSSTRTKGSERD